jgi:hypothetical protein
MRARSNAGFGTVCRPGPWWYSLRADISRWSKSIWYFSRGLTSKGIQRRGISFDFDRFQAYVGASNFVKEVGFILVFEVNIPEYW